MSKVVQDALILAQYPGRRDTSTDTVLHRTCNIYKAWYTLQQIIEYNLLMYFSEIYVKQIYFMIYSLQTELKNVS